MKSVIVLRGDLGSGFLANASACITTGLFNGEKDVLGPAIQGDVLDFIPITKIPIMIMKQNKPIKDLLKKAKKLELKYMIFTKEGQSTTSYDEYIERVKGKGIEDLDVLGIGVIGEDSLVNKFCGDLPLFK